MQPNEDAHFIANASQEGGGTIEERLRQENDQMSPLSAEQMSETQDVINLQRQVPTAALPRELSAHHVKLASGERRVG